MMKKQNEKALKNKKIKNRVALITGGARGLGLAFARLCASRGYSLALCSRSLDDLVVAEAELKRDFPQINVLTGVCDVAVVEQVSWFVENVDQELGGVHILINNAGVIQVGPYESMSISDFNEVINANLYGMINTCQVIVPKMIEQGFGRILNVTSVGGVFPVPHLLPYTASKFGAIGFSTALAAEVKKHSITVTTGVPGLMRTGSFLNALFKGDQEREKKFFALSSVLPLLTMSPDRAARIMLRACERGRSFKVVGLPTKAQRLLFSLAPNLSIKLMGLLNRTLPALPAIAGATQVSPTQTMSKARESTARKGKFLDNNNLDPLTRSQGLKAARKYNELRG